MIRINLVPFRAARKKENIRRQISVFLLSVLLIVVAGLLLYTRWSSQIQALETKNKATKKELAAAAKKAKEVDKIKRQLATLRKKTQIIKNLKSNRKAPVRLLDVMTQVTVENRMWFNKFNFRGRNVSIAGTAMDNQTVADFMTRLEQTKLFASVNLRTLSHKKVGRNSLKRFSINCKTAVKKKAKKKSGKKAAKKKKK